MILAFAAALLFTVRRISIPELGRIHPTLRLLGLVTPLLIVRGAWGIVQAVDLSQSFASPESYGASTPSCDADSAGPGGLRGEFVAKEYALATLVRYRLAPEPDDDRWSGCRHACCSRPGPRRATTTRSPTRTSMLPTLPRLVRSPTSSSTA